MRDDGGTMSFMVERIRYSVYGEPTVFPYSFAGCTDTRGEMGLAAMLHCLAIGCRIRFWPGRGRRQVRAADRVPCVPRNRWLCRAWTKIEELPYTILPIKERS